MQSPHAFDVAVFAPLRNTFHYLPMENSDGHAAVSGSLVKIPFGRGRRIGIVLNRVQVTSQHQLKPIMEVFDSDPIIGHDLMRLARWAADYYHHPFGEVLAATLPGPLRQGPAPQRRFTMEWVAVELNLYDYGVLQKKAPRQAELLRQIVARPMCLTEFQALGYDWRRALKELEKKALVTQRRRTPVEALGESLNSSPIALNSTQRDAAASLIETFGEFRAFLLHGVTGSGKTEVYIAVIERALEKNLQALMLVPEIILTQQMVQRLQARFGAAVGVLHSAMSDSERAQVWLQCRDGDVKILMGTRSAVWAPLPHIGIIIVDEEHDSSFKQQEGFRYSARDVATKRAQLLGVPIVLGTATPSLEAHLNVESKKFTYLSLPHRVGTARLPKISCIDVRGLRLTGGLSDQLCREIEACLQRGEQTLLFLNRRGFAPVVLCHQCGYVAACRRCDAKLVWHKERKVLICHHCGAQKRTQHIEACCAAPELVPLGVGTEQVEEALNELFPQKVVIRIDRDTMRRKSVMDETFAAIRDGTVDVLIGTQMLAKGHDFSRVTLVGIIDADSQMFSTDFRADEKLAQTIVQVSGRAGRAEFPGSVLIQTHHPHHELLQLLITDGYDRFAEVALAERKRAALPPYVPMALIRAESPNAQMPMKFLAALAAKVKSRRVNGLDILGPIPAVMERRAGRYRAQIMVTADNRRVLATSIKYFLADTGDISTHRQVRWSIDIDPYDTM